jgi:hypothetical protein
MPRPTSNRHEKFKGRSKSEGKYGDYLISRGVPFDYEPEAIPYTRETTYTPDFRVAREGGVPLWIEFKGWLEGEDRTELNAFLCQYPGFPLCMVFESSRGASQKVSKGSSVTMADWLEARGVPWTHGHVLPEEWLDPAFTPQTRGYPKGSRANYRRH